MIHRCIDTPLGYTPCSLWEAPQTEPVCVRSRIQVNVCVCVCLSLSLSLSVPLSLSPSLSLPLSLLSPSLFVTHNLSLSLTLRRHAQTCTHCSLSRTFLLQHYGFTYLLIQCNVMEEQRNVIMLHACRGAMHMHVIWFQILCVSKVQIFCLLLFVISLFVVLLSFYYLYCFSKMQIWAQGTSCHQSEPLQQQCLQACK